MKLKMVCANLLWNVHKSFFFKPQQNLNMNICLLYGGSRLGICFKMLVGVVIVYSGEAFSVDFSSLFMFLYIT